MFAANAPRLHNRAMTDFGQIARKLAPKRVTYAQPRPAEEDETERLRHSIRQLPIFSLIWIAVMLGALVILGLVAIAMHDDTKPRSPMKYSPRRSDSGR